MIARSSIAGLCAALCAVAALPAWAKPPKAEPAAAAATPAPAPVAAPAAEPTPAAPAAPGLLILAADDDGLVAEVSGTIVGLKKGDNRFDLPAGSARVVVKTAAGKVVHEGVAVIPSAAQERIAIISLGKLEVRAPANAKVAVDGKDLTASGDAYAADLQPGSHSVLVTSTGHVGKKGTVEIEAGKKAAIAASLEAFEPAGHETLAWVGIIGGSALVVAALIIEANTKFDQAGGDPMRWTLLGVGSAGLVGGTMLLKSAMDDAATPPVQDGTFDVKVTQVRGGAMARLAMRF